MKISKVLETHRFECKAESFGWLPLLKISPPPLLFKTTEMLTLFFKNPPKVHFSGTGEEKYLIFFTQIKVFRPLPFMKHQLGNRELTTAPG